MKPRNKKILKYSLIGVATTAFTGLIVGVSTSWNGLTTISAGGSSAVLSLMNAFSNKYKKSDIVVSPGGSGAGINHILEGTKQIGLSSKNPHILDSNDQNKIQIWKEKKVKTLTIAWDGMVLVYKPGVNTTKVIDINENTIAKIYLAFSGLKSVNFNDLGIDNDKTIIEPYARNGGSTTSGTADAFLNDSNLKWDIENKDKIISILTNGNYQGNVKQTAESNSQAWNRIKDAKSGSMTYLSAGFVFNNLKEIENKGFKIATYKDIKLNEMTVANGYNWFRPFNLIFSLKMIKDKSASDIKDLIEWIFKEEASKIIKEEGYVVLTEQQINTMKTSQNGEQASFFNDSASDSELGYSGAQKK